MHTLIYALIIFGLLIFVHEFGHFIVAKLVGVRVEEFSIGMGPNAFSFKKGETLYSVRILPIGGYIKMSGETGMEIEGEESFAADDPKNFNNKTILQRAAVISAGPIMNFLLAILLFAYLFSFVGLPHYSSEIGDVVEGSPAEKAGIQRGDKIVQVDGKKVKEWSDIIISIHGRSGEKIDFTIERNGELEKIPLVPKYDEEMKTDLVGIVATKPVIKKYGLLSGLWLGVEKNIEIVQVTISEITKMILGKVGTEGVAGPVGIVNIIGEYAQVGLIPIITLTAYISVSLGLMNLLPIPALDGSRLIFLFIEGLRGRPVDAKKENLIHLVGFSLLMIFMILITYKDIRSIFI